MDTSDDTHLFDLPDFGKVELDKNILTFRVEHEGRQLSFLTTFFSKDPSKCLDKIEQAVKKAGFRKEDLASMMQSVSKILPDIFGSLVAMESTKNEEPKEEEPNAKEMDSEAEREADRILSAENPLIEIERHLDSIVCGESNNKKLLFIKCLSGRAPDTSLKQFITLKGKEGSGKTRLLEMIVQTFRVKKVGRLTRHALDYLDLTNYDILVIQELGSADREEGGLSTLKFMSADDAGYTVEVATRDFKTGEMTTEEHTIPPMTVISSTTRVTLDGQFERRNDIINANESEEQTKAVLAWKASYEKEKMLVLLGKKPWTDRDFAIKVVKKVVEKVEPIEVQIPFPKSITGIFRRLPLRARGDYDKVLSTIRLYHMLLGRKEPTFEIAGRKIMFANPQVAVDVVKIYSDALLTMLTGLESRTRELAQTLSKMGVSKEGDAITKEIRDKIAKQLKNSPKTIYGNLEELYEEGYVSKTKEGKTITYTLQYESNEIEELLSPITKQLLLDNDIFHEMLREGFLALANTISKKDSAKLFHHWSKPLREKFSKTPNPTLSGENGGRNGDSSKISNNSTPFPLAGKEMSNLLLLVPSLPEEQNANERNGITLCANCGSEIETLPRIEGDKKYHIGCVSAQAPRIENELNLQNSSSLNQTWRNIDNSRASTESSGPRLSFSMNNCVYDIANDDFRNSTIDDNSVDLMSTDLPWSKEEVLGSASDLGLFCKRKLKERHLLVTYAGTYTWELTKELIGQHLTFVACRHFKRIGLRHDSYEMAGHGKIEDLSILFFCKGNPSNEQIVQIDSFELQTEGMDKRWHEWGQPVDEWIQLIQHFSKPGDLVVDPMLGGGTAVQACIDAKRSCISYEKESKWFGVVKKRFSQYLNTSNHEASSI